MNSHHLVFPTVVAAIVLGVHARVPAQDQPSMPDMSPAPQVEKFKHMIGMWKGMGKVFETPGAEGSPWTAWSIIKKSLGGHFIQDDAVVDLGEAAPGKLNFRTYYGFNKETKKFMVLATSNMGNVEGSTIDWADTDIFVYTTIGNLKGHVVRDRWIVKTIQNSFTVLCKRAIGSGPEFTHVEGSYRRSRIQLQAAAMKASPSFLPAPKSMARATKMAGVYKLKGSMIPAPGAPEMAISGVETVTPIFGGSVLAFDVVGDPVQGMPAYKSFAAMAWNNTKNCYSMIYLNNMGECGIASCWFTDATTLVTTSAGVRHGQPTIERHVSTLDKNGLLTAVKSHSITGSADPVLSFKGTFVKQ